MAYPNLVGGLGIGKVWTVSTIDHSLINLSFPITQCVQRTLDQLVAEGKLVEKIYGKQKVYVANQVCWHM